MKLGTFDFPKYSTKSRALSEWFRVLREITDVTRRLASSDNVNNNENDPTKTNPTNNEGNLKQPKHEGQQNRTSAIKSALMEARHCTCFSCNVLKHLAEKDDEKNEDALTFITRNWCRPLKSILKSDHDFES
jgi:hypothetical protein